MTAKTRWAIAIVGLLLGNVIAMVVLAVIATDGDTQVIPRYYEKGVHYDDQLAQAARSRALGWRATAEIEGGAIEIAVHDRTGAPLDGARVHVAGYQRAYASDRLELELVAVGAGLYRGAARDHVGLHDLTVTVERDGARFEKQLVVESR